MPMNTTLVNRVTAWTTRPVAAPDHLLDDLTDVEVAIEPAWPVAQKPQPIAHPAWVETHTVERSG